MIRMEAARGFEWVQQKIKKCHLSVIDIWLTFVVYHFFVACKSVCVWVYFLSNNKVVWVFVFSTTLRCIYCSANSFHIAARSTFKKCVFNLINLLWNFKEPKCTQLLLWIKHAASLIIWGLYQSTFKFLK